MYGVGATDLGSLGAVFGFPIMIISSIIVGNLWGLISKEWKGTSNMPRRIMFMGVLILGIAVFVIGFSNKLIT